MRLKIVIEETEDGGMQATSVGNPERIVSALLEVLAGMIVQWKRKDADPDEVVRQTAKSLARRMAGMERGERPMEGMTINLEEMQKQEGACEDG